MVNRSGSWGGDVQCHSLLFDLGTGKIYDDDL